MANYDFSLKDPRVPGSTVTDTAAVSPGEPNTPLPPAFLDIPNIHNFRNLGVQHVPGGRQVRTDLVFRSAEPSQVTEEGIKRLRELGVTTIYDLRSEAEIDRNKAVMPVRDIPGITRRFLPVFGAKDPTKADDHTRRMRWYGEEGSEGFVKAYLEIMDFGKDAYRQIFTHLRDRPNEGLLVHCVAGKDRTGVAIALILGLVGISDHDIAEEYALTELGLAQWTATIIAHILRDPVIGGDRASVERMVSAKKVNMEAFLPRMRERWESPEGYLTNGLGFSHEDVVKIRENVTEPIA